MEKVILGRTGLEVTIAGLGCGGHSRLGLAKFGQNHAGQIVRTAFEQGVNFFDTAVAYGTETAVGQGLKGIDREQYVLSTKFPYKNPDGVKSGAQLEKSIDESLALLNTDYIDIYHLHGVHPDDYEIAIEKLLPALKRAQQAGKIRWLGLTEVFGKDTNHKMLEKALPDDYFDVIMVGYNLLNPSAAKKILPIMQKQNIGGLCMFAVRSALSNPEQLKIDLSRILAHQQANPEEIKKNKDLAFLINASDANSIMEAAYRYCRHTPGIHVTLTGTGSEAHLLENIQSIQKAPLPQNVMEKIDFLFGNVDCISGQ